MVICGVMIKNAYIIGLIFIFLLGLTSSPALAFGKNHGHQYFHPQQSHHYEQDVVDDDDNEHPSGKDKSVEHGKSFSQGKSESDPDDNGKGPDRSNGGPDKPPKGTGGVDREDQDGNNGCGNDDDFEDDNEGWCGKKPKKDSHDHDYSKDHDKKDPTTKSIDSETNGEVLSAKVLPITGADIISVNNLSIILVALFVGALFYLISRRFEKREIK